MLTASQQLFFLFILALPIATISWTVTHEEVFREPREWCRKRSITCRNIVQRKVFYLFTCEYCFSFYVAAAVIVATRFTLLYVGWRGYSISLLSLVWLANLYMSIFGRIRLNIKRERLELAREEKDVDEPITQ